MPHFPLAPYQFIIAALSLFMIFSGFSRYLSHSKGQTGVKLLVRLVVWGGMMSVALFPKITYSLARVIGIEGNINAAILTGFLLIFLIIFKVLSVIERIEYQITQLTRQEALNNIKNHKQSK